RNLNRRLGTFGGLLERDLEVVPEVRTPLGSTPPPAASAKDVAKAEHVAKAGEDVGKVGEDRGVDAAGSGAAAEPGMPEAVVHAPLLAIREDGIRFGRFLERFLRLVIARIAIRMVLQRKLPVGALDLLVVRISLDAQHLVVVPLRHAAHPLATLTIDGRSSRSPSM